MVCMSVNWTAGDMSVCLFQLVDHRTGIDEICLRVRCEVLMVVTEDFWYMILCNLVNIYWLFYPEDGGNMFFWNVSKYPQWSKFGPLKLRTLHWLKMFGSSSLLVRCRIPASWSCRYSVLLINSATNWWQSGTVFILTDTLSWHATTMHVLHSHFTCVPVLYFSV